MNRHWISITKTENMLENEEGKEILWYAESNSPNDGLRLSGFDEVKEAVKIFLESLPPTYDKEAALNLMEECVDGVFE